MVEFRARLIGTILLCGLGLWFALSGRAKFSLGGDPDSPHNQKHVIPVNAAGLDAIAIGTFIIGLGVINLALGIRGPRRIPVFWIGAALFLAAVLYGIVLAVR